MCLTSALRRWLFLKLRYRSWVLSLPIILIIIRFNQACFLYFRDWRATHKRFLTLRTHTNHDKFMSVIVLYSFFDLPITFFINRVWRCQNLAFSEIPWSVLHFAKFSPAILALFFSPPLRFHGSISVGSVSRTDLFSQAFSKTFTLDDLSHILITCPLLMIIIKQEFLRMMLYLPLWNQHLEGLWTR